MKNKIEFLIPEINDYITTFLDSIDAINASVALDIKIITPIRCFTLYKIEQLSLDNNIFTKVLNFNNTINVKTLFINLSNNFTEILLINIFNKFKNINTLRFNDYFNINIKPNILPNTITEIFFGNNFNKEIIVDVLPNNLKRIYFGEKFNNDNKELCPFIFPMSLKCLVFGEQFNNATTAIQFNVIPTNLEYLCFTCTHLSNSLVYFPEYFFPYSLKYLYLPNTFTNSGQPLYLPKNCVIQNESYRNLIIERY